MKFATCLFILGSTVLSAYEIRIKVVDETLAPVSGAQTIISFTNLVIGGDDHHEGLTDQDGWFMADGKAQASVFVQADKAGYYEARFEHLPNDRDLNLTVVLPRIIAPIPLLVRQAGAWTKEAFQASKPDAVLDFDLEVGEMVKPRGKGKVADIRFKFRHVFKGWKYPESEMAELRQLPHNRDKSEDEIRREMGNWDGELEVSFPGEKEGLCEEQEHFLSYSQLKMPHRAPNDGYTPTMHYTENNYSPRSARENVGFFLRTRVKLDKDGKIVSANYAKVMGDFRLDARSGVGFTYYFNPVPNDRNLEFDPKRNLFPEKLPGAMINEP